MVIGDAPARALTRGGPAHAALTTLTSHGVPTGALAPVEVLTTPGAAALVTVLPVSEPSYAAGQGPIMVDFRHAVYGDFPLLLAVILACSFVLLIRGIRSVLLPLKAVLLNLASVGVVFGVMVFVWQDGHATRAL